MLGDDDYLMIDSGLGAIASAIDDAKDNLPYIDGDQINEINYHFSRLEGILCAAFGVEEHGDEFVKINQQKGN